MEENTVRAIRVELDAFSKEVRREIDAAKADIIKEIHSVGPLGQFAHLCSSRSQGLPFEKSQTSNGMTKDLSTENSGEQQSRRKNLRRSIAPTDQSARPQLAPQGTWLLLPEQEDTPEARRHKWLYGIVHSHAFDSAISAAILLNIMAFAIQTDYMARNWTEEVPPVFDIVEVLCCLIFTTEIVLRLCVFGWMFWCDTRWYWNVSDFLLVAFQQAELVIQFFSLHANKLEILRMLRVIRVARLSRLLHLMPAFRMLLVSIASSGQGLLWVFLLVSLVTGAFGIVLTQIVTDHKVRLGREAMEHEEVLNKFFGDVPKAMLALYETISDGLHWGELADPLMDFCSPWVVSVFIVYSVFVVFALMNVVTSFFVETALRVAKEDHIQGVAKILKELFNLDDENPRRTVTYDDFMAQMDDSRMKEFLNKLDLTPEQVRESHFFQLIDVDNSGSVDGHELTKGCLRLMGDARAIDLAGLAHEMREEHQKQESHREFEYQCFSSMLGLLRKNRFGL